MTTEEPSTADDTDSDAKMEDMMEETRDEDGGADLTVCSAEVMAINSSEPTDTSIQPPLVLPHIPLRLVLYCVTVGALGLILSCLK